jgi:hypothetical protein
VQLVLRATGARQKQRQEQRQQELVRTAFPPPAERALEQQPERLAT